jgi:hypothetical protein
MDQGHLNRNGKHILDIPQSGIRYRKTLLRYNLYFWVNKLECLLPESLGLGLSMGPIRQVVIIDKARKACQRQTL